MTHREHRDSRGWLYWYRFTSIYTFVIMTLVLVLLIKGSA